MKRADYFEFSSMTEKLFYGVGLSEEQWILAVRQIESYFDSTGETDVLAYLGIGIVRRFQNGVVVRARMKYLHGENAGRELCPYEICNLAQFLPYGPHEYEVRRYRTQKKKTEVMRTQEPDCG